LLQTLAGVYKPLLNLERSVVYLRRRKTSPPVTAGGKRLPHCKAVLQDLILGLR